MTMLPIYQSDIHNPTPSEFLALRQRLFHSPVARELPRPVPIRSARAVDALVAQFRVVPVEPKSQPVLPIRVRAILEEVGEKHGFTCAAMQSLSRTRPLVRARQEAMYRLCMECQWMSYPAIGRALGGRDHTTSIHGARKHALRHGLPVPDRSAEWVRS